MDQVGLRMELRRFAEAATATSTVYEDAVAEVRAYMVRLGGTQEMLDEQDVAIEEVREREVKTRRPQTFGPTCGGRDMQPGPNQEKNKTNTEKNERRALEKQQNPAAEQLKQAHQWRGKMTRLVDKVASSRATGTGASSSSHQ